MPAFNFKARFIAPIRAGTKRQTIRAQAPTGFRDGHWAPLYSGQRTRGCLLIGSAKMVTPWTIRIDRDDATISTAIWTLDTADKLDEFARADGFDDWADMNAYWDKLHPGVRQFEGVLIVWSAFTHEYRLGAAA
jgi:hypothetical protein